MGAELDLCVCAYVIYWCVVCVVQSGSFHM